MKSGFYSSGMHLSSLIWLFKLLWEESRRGIFSAVMRVGLLLDIGGRGFYLAQLHWNEELSCLDVFAGPSWVRSVGCINV